MMNPSLYNWQHGRKALVLYGSETGNSQEAAEELGRVLERLHFVTSVVEMNNVELTTLLNHTIVVFALSTTGQGEFPTNAKQFWKSLLRKRLPAGCLSRVNFTTFGLGDSSYPKFNFAARKLHKRLEQLGAKEVYPRGEADEQHTDGIDTAFLPWSADFRKHLLEQYPLPAGTDPIPDDVLLPLKWELRLDEDADSSSIPPDSSTIETKPTEFKPQMNGLSESNEKIPVRQPRVVGQEGELPVTLTSNVRVTLETHWQDVRLLTFHSDHKAPYMPGDIVEVYPHNFPEDVDALINLMDWSSVADTPLAWKHSATVPSASPEPSKIFRTLPQLTIRNLLSTALDITAVPTRSFLRTISHYTTDETHKERLLEFANPFYTDEFYDYATRPRRSIIEVLQDFPSVKLPWSAVPSIFPRLKGRKFSICSGGVQKTIQKSEGKEVTQIQILVAIVKYRTVIKKMRQGVCSRYLANLPVDSKLSVKLSKGGFEHGREQAGKPILMVAPGTGVAPMRSLLWERASLQKECDIGKAVLVYGGRNKEADFFFKDEWDELKSDGRGLEVCTAFSRDQKAKVYVQDILRQNAETIGPLLKEGIVYVCGSSGKMPMAVREALLEVIEKDDAFHGENGEEGATGEARRKRAEDWLARMEKEKRYIQDTW